MNNWRIAGLLLAAILAAWLTLRSCSSDEESRIRESTPTREQFHAAKPLSVVVVYADQSGNTATGTNGPDNAWLERELRYLLIHGQMRVAAVEPAAAPIYVLRVEVPRAPATTATLKLIAPGGSVERTQEIAFADHPLATMQSFAAALPSFLGAAPAAGDWASLLGTEDSAAYDDFLRSSDELLGRQGRGFTRPLVMESSVTVDRLESLTQRHPRFARAFGLLAEAYLSLGGKDEASLTQLANAAAERALTIDPTQTDAQAAQGLVRARRGEWAEAMEHFDKTLLVDANASAALEGLACLLVDVGHASAALPIAHRAVALQPASIGAQECLTYAQLSDGTDAKELESSTLPLAAAQAVALDALLSHQPAIAQAVMQGVAGPNNAAWIDPWLQAAADRHQTSAALQAITRAASDRVVDPVTEVVCGAALRQTDFVFNRLSRLHKQNEPLPLRVLWLPRTNFLRQQPRFEETIGAAGLPPFWQDHGIPDICAAEPEVYGCKVKTQKIRKEG